MGFWSIFFIGFGSGVVVACIVGFVALVLSGDVEADEVDEHARGGIG